MATDCTFQSETMDYTVHDSGWLSSKSHSFKAPIVDSNGNKKTKKKIKLAVINCLKCNELIKEKHLYAISDNYWHKSCVRCDNCNVHLDETGFLINTTLLCRTCYHQSVHVINCCGCKLPMQTHEIAMYVFNQPYHLACFKCNYCKMNLSKGDKFVFNNGVLICKQDYEKGSYLNSQTTQLTKQQSCTLDTKVESTGIRRKTKITNQQRQYLENYYLKNSNPSIKQRAYISHELDLPVKVVQTWFCNYRTKMKIHRNEDINDKLMNTGHDRCNSEKMKRIFNEQYFSPEQDCGTNCQISQSTEDHTSPQDLSSDLSGMYTCPDIAPVYLQQQPPSIDDNDLTYADLSNSCVKDIDQSLMSKTCLTWS